MTMRKSTKSVRAALLELLAGDEAKTDAFMSLVANTNRTITDSGMITRAKKRPKLRLTASDVQLRRAGESISETVARMLDRPRAGSEEVTRETQRARIRDTFTVTSTAPWILAQSRVRKALGRGMNEIAENTLRSVPSRPVGSRRRTARPIK